MSVVALPQGPARPARGELGSRRQLCVPKGTAARTLAWLLPGHRGVKAVLGAEEQCTLPYLFPLSFNPLLPTQDPATSGKGKGHQPQLIWYL